MQWEIVALEVHEQKYIVEGDSIEEAIVNHGEGKSKKFGSTEYVADDEMGMSVEDIPNLDIEKVDSFIIEDGPLKILGGIKKISPVSGHVDLSGRNQRPPLSSRPWS